MKGWQPESGRTMLLGTTLLGTTTKHTHWAHMSLDAKHGTRSHRHRGHGRSRSLNRQRHWAQPAVAQPQCGRWRRIIGTTTGQYNAMSAPFFRAPRRSEDRIHLSSGATDLGLPERVAASIPSRIARVASAPGRQSEGSSLESAETIADRRENRSGSRPAGLDDQSGEVRDSHDRTVCEHSGAHRIQASPLGAAKLTTARLRR